MKSTKVCTVLATEFYSVDLRILLSETSLANELRLYIMDSNGEYCDDWAFDVGDNLNDMMQIIFSESRKGYEDFAKFIGETFDKKVYTDASLLIYDSLIKKHGREYVNRIGDCVLVTKEL